MARKKKNEDEPQDNQDKINNESDDTFGLPEVEYEPLKRDEPVVEPTPEPVNKPVEEPVYERPVEDQYEVKQEGQGASYRDENTHQDLHEYAATYHYEPEKPMWPKILGVLALLLIIGAGVYYFVVYKPEQDKIAGEKARREEAAEARRKREADAAALRDKAKADTEQRRLDSLANIPKVGTVEVLSERTGQYYVVVASAIDDDLIMDRANNLTKTGKSLKVIPPFGKTKFYRLAVDAKDNYTDAQASADGMKGGEFGDQLWVVRY
jgi:hypothetical protein